MYVCERASVCVLAYLCVCVCVCCVRACVRACVCGWVSERDLRNFIAGLMFHCTLAGCVTASRASTLLLCPLNVSLILTSLLIKTTLKVFFVVVIHCIVVCYPVVFCIIILL